jgi:hypothetical protein
MARKAFASECHEEVTRRGMLEPCDRVAVAVRIDPDEGGPYPVCARLHRGVGERVGPTVVRAEVRRLLVTIVEFLTAQLDEAERFARLCGEAYPGEWELSDRGWKATVRADEPAFRVVTELEQDQASDLDVGWLGGYLQHIADHSPAFVLADIAAKRRIIERYNSVSNLGSGRGPATDPYIVATDLLESVMKWLAEPFADRPGYDEAWRPA